jgi:UPF0716 family protein affecting phage T7 exclusion
MDLVLLGVMVYYTSWLFMLGFVFISGIIGAWLLNNGFYKYGNRIGKISTVDEMPADLFLRMIAHFSAGVLFIVPGILTDLAALALISPAGKRLTRILITSLFGQMFSHLSNRNYFSGSTDEKPAKDEIIDVQVTNGDEKTPGNGR